jgi:transposase
MKSAIYVGIDIARHWLQVCCKELCLEQSMSYESQGLNALIKQLKKRRSQVHIICEASGGLEALLVRRLSQAQIKFSVLNPRQVRDFARAQNRLAKSDKIDAALLADFGRRMQPAPTPAPHRLIQQLAALVARRQELLDFLRCRAKSARPSHPALGPPTASGLAWPAASPPWPIGSAHQNLGQCDSLAKSAL